MQIKPPYRRLRTLTVSAVAFLLLTLTACDPERSSGLTPDSIAIGITGLPAELKPDVTITGPDGYEQTITESTRIENLAPGDYAITANTVAFRGNPFDPDREAHQLTLEPGASKNAHVAYAPHRAYSEGALERLNELRTAAGVPTVTLDAEGSLPNWLHTRYLAENGTTGHNEDPSLPWYTPEGDQAGRASNLLYSRTTYGFSPSWESPNWLINGFVAAPFHLFSMLSPTATSVRMATYYAEGDCEDPSTCDVSDWHWMAGAVDMRSTNAWPEDKIVRFPEDQQTISILAFHGENPSPVASCDGYTAPAGLPIFAMHARGNTPTIVDTNVTLEGKALEHCAFTAATYTNPDADHQALGRRILEAYGAVVLVPREPLQPESAYEVTITYESTSDMWEFHTATLEMTPQGTPAPTTY